MAPPPLVQSTANSAKTMAQQIAKQMAREPLEILKNAGNQVTGEEKSPAQETPQASGEQTPEHQKKLIGHQQEIQDKMKAGRRMEALNRELEDIHKQDVFKELQAKISQGEDVPLEDYSELSMEQRQVLQAQMEATHKQMVAQSNQGGAELLMPASKKGRRMQGQKQEAEKQQTRVEKPVPPSG